MSEKGAGIITREEQDAILAEALELQGEQYDHEDEALVDTFDLSIADRFERRDFLRKIWDAEFGNRMEYVWKDHDLSNFLHVFWQDDLWSELPLDCVLVVMKHCKTHPITRDSYSFIRGYGLPSVWFKKERYSSSRQYVPYDPTDVMIERFRRETAIPGDRFTYVPVSNHSTSCNVLDVVMPAITHIPFLGKVPKQKAPSLGVVKKKNKKNKKKPHQGGMKDFKRQPNRAMRRR